MKVGIKCQKVVVQRWHFVCYEVSRQSGMVSSRLPRHFTTNKAIIEHSHLSPFDPDLHGHDQECRRWDREGGGGQGNTGNINNFNVRDRTDRPTGKEGGLEERQTEEVSANQEPAFETTSTGLGHAQSQIGVIWTYNAAGTYGTGQQGIEELNEGDWRLGIQQLCKEGGHLVEGEERMGMVWQVSKRELPNQEALVATPEHAAMEHRVTRSAKNVALTEGISNPPRKSGKRKVPASTKTAPEPPAAAKDKSKTTANAAAALVEAKTAPEPSAAAKKPKNKSKTTANVAAAPVEAPADDADALPKPPRPKPRPKEKTATTAAVVQSNGDLAHDPFNLSARVNRDIRRADASLKSSQRVLNEIAAEDQEDFTFDDRDTQSYDELTTPIAKHRQSADARSPGHSCSRSHSRSPFSSPPRPRSADARSPCRKEATDNENNKTPHASPTRGRSRRSETRPASSTRPASVDSVMLSLRLRPHHPSLPPSSPLLESELDDSNNNYKQMVAKAKAALAKQAAREHTMPPTVKEADEEDLGEAPAQKKKQGGDAQGKQKNNGGATGTWRPAKGKGRKAKATPEPDSMEDEDAGSGDDDDKVHKGGPVPAAIKEHLFVAHDTFTAEVAALAKECGKSPTTLHQLVGSLTKTTRASSPWNIYQQWHAETHPKASEMSTQDYNTLARESFKTACRLPDDELSDPDTM
ncbi:hypothetical protein DFH09DRAFT_1073657 [Mycena vulgaris]|nr:hypothetical protein DFH09DRAFT_1073657 [Mycena vulgaris]